jgi:hypothetical protein
MAEEGRAEAEMRTENSAVLPEVLKENGTAWLWGIGKMANGRDQDALKLGGCLLLVSGDLLPPKFTMTGGGEVHIDQAVPISIFTEANETSTTLQLPIRMIIVSLKGRGSSIRVGPCQRPEYSTRHADRI